MPRAGAKLVPETMLGCRSEHRMRGVTGGSCIRAATRDTTRRRCCLSRYSVSIIQWDLQERRSYDPRRIFDS